MNYLKEGVTGKQLTNQKRKSQNSIKKTQSSFSNLRAIALNDKQTAKYVELMGLTLKDLSPANLRPYQSDHEKGQKNECTAFMLCNQIQRLAKAWAKFDDLKSNKAKAEAYMTEHEAKAKKAKERREAKKVSLKKVA